tara:strand:+ start:5894 stop:6370 length:477 start_codon:yes stop_codon:yes gene_type:complete
LGIDFCRNVCIFQVKTTATQGQDAAMRACSALEEATRQVDERLHKKAVACTGQLLSSVAGVDSLDEELKVVKTASSELKTDMARLRKDVLLPFRDLKKRTYLLERCQQTNVLTRRVLRFLFDTKKLRNQVETSGGDYTKAANTLADLESALEDGVLDG